MTPENGYKMVEYMTPGFYVSMGVESAEMRQIQPLPYRKMKNLKGFHSWLEYDLGFELSFWAFCFGRFVEVVYGHKTTREEWEWLNSKSATLKGAEKWVSEIKEAAT